MQKNIQRIFYLKNQVETFKKMYSDINSITKKQMRDESKKIFDFNNYLVAYSGPTEIKNFKI